MTLTSEIKKKFADSPKAALVKKDSNFEALLKSHKLNNEEFAKVEEILGRMPTLSELGVFSAMWSEHCSYKSSRVHLKNFPTTGKHVVVGPGENAGVVHVEGDLCLAFKMESHNHPSFIEPYQGAATGVGGIMRDVFCMGARPIANLNCLRFGDKKNQRTPYLFSHAVKGIGDYGNCVGVPTIGGSIHFDSTYDGNCLVNAMTVGVIDRNKIYKGFASGQGNFVVYVGSATGRDGVHGATMASDSFSNEQKGERSTIQVGDPFREKLLIEATLAVLEKNLVVGLQDMGAAGLTSSSVEMAGRAGNGLLIDLDKVPVRTTNMTAYELLLSESQERMLMVVEPSKWADLKRELDFWNLETEIIGEVTNTGRFQCIFGGLLEVDIPAVDLTDKAPVLKREYTLNKKSEPFSWQEVLGVFSQREPTEVVGAMLAQVGEKSFIYNQYDHHIGTKTVYGPKEGGAAVMWLRHPQINTGGKDFLGMAVSTACNERYCKNDPKNGGALAVIQAVRKIAMRGATALGATDCLNFGNPQVPEIMGEFVGAIQGISEACKILEVPIVSGNVSLYNETDGTSIYPTPMIGVVGKIEDVRKVPKRNLDQEGDLWLLKGKNFHGALGGSLLAKVLNLPIEKGSVPLVDWPQISEALTFVKQLATIEQILAMNDVGSGGILVSALEMLENEKLLLNIEQKDCSTDAKAWLEKYCGEFAAAFLVAVTPAKSKEWASQKLNLNYNELIFLGKVSASDSQCSHRFNSMHLDSKNLTASYRKSLAL